MYKNYIKIIGLIALPIWLLLLPNNFFDNGQSICPSKFFLNIECLGCGITRAIQHLIHLDFKIAWNYNKLSYLILSVAVYIWSKEFHKTVIKIKSK